MNETVVLTNITLKKAELIDTSGVARTYQPLIKAIMDSKEFFELSLASTEIKDIVESEFKYVRRLSEYFKEYERDLEGWFIATEKHKAYAKVEVGLADAASFQCEAMGKKCVESRVKFLKHITSRKSIFLQTAKLRSKLEKHVS